MVSHILPWMLRSKLEHQILVSSQNQQLRKWNHSSNYLILNISHWRDREAISLLEDFHSGEIRMRPEISEWDYLWEFLNKPYIHTLPDDSLVSRFWIIVLVSDDELRLVRMWDWYDSGEPHDARSCTRWMVEKYSISDPHTISHIVASLIVADSEPTRWSISDEVVYRVLCWFGFHEPGGHRW